MTLGTVFYERYLNDKTYETHFEWLIQTGFKHLEFTPHDRLMPRDVLSALLAKSREAGLQLSFHSPDFLEPNQYGLASAFAPKGFDGLIKLMDHLAHYKGANDLPLILHGMSQSSMPLVHEKNHKYTLDDANAYAIDGLLNEMTRRSLPLVLCLENTTALDELAFGQSLGSFYDLATAYPNSPLQFCLDLTHLWRHCQLEGHNPLQEIDRWQALTEKISHCHLHGFSRDLTKSHLALNFQNDDFINFVKYFHSKKLKKTYVLECFEMTGTPILQNYEHMLLQQFETLSRRVIGD